MAESSKKSGTAGVKSPQRPPIAASHNVSTAGPPAVGAGRSPTVSSLAILRRADAAGNSSSSASMIAANASGLQHLALRAGLTRPPTRFKGFPRTPLRDLPMPYRGGLPGSEQGRPVFGARALPSAAPTKTPPMAAAADANMSGGCSAPLQRCFETCAAASRSFFCCLRR